MGYGRPLLPRALPPGAGGVRQGAGCEEVNRLYTIGYVASTPEDLRAYVRALGAMLCDIRFSPHSRAAMWEGRAIAWAVGGANYMHLRSLGNENYKGNGGPLKLHDPRAGAHFMKPVLAKRPAILLCACFDVYQCHRIWAAEYLARVLGPGLEVEHLPGRFRDWKEGA